MLNTADLNLSVISPLRKTSTRAVFQCRHLLVLCSYNYVNSVNIKL